MTRLRPWRVAVGLLFAAVPAVAQVPPTAADLTGSADLQSTVDSLDRAGLHHESLAFLEEILRRRPDDYRAHVLAAREAFLIAYDALYSNGDTTQAWSRRAIGYATWALAVRPRDPEPRYTNLAAHGLIGIVASGLDQAREGVVVDSAARALLADDPQNADAHNALGRLYADIAGRSWIERLFARPVLGGDLLRRAQWEAAEEELRRAVELRPERNVYYVDLAVLYLKRGRLAEARALLDRALAVPLEIPLQEHSRDDARRFLRELDRREGVGG